MYDWTNILSIPDFALNSDLIESYGDVLIQQIKEWGFIIRNKVQRISRLINILTDSAERQVRTWGSSSFLLGGKLYSSLFIQDIRQITLMHFRPWSCICCHLQKLKWWRGGDWKLWEGTKRTPIGTAYDIATFDTCKFQFQSSSVLHFKSRKDASNFFTGW